MRTIGFRSNVLFILAAGFGLVAALGRAWYAPAPGLPAGEKTIGQVHGPVEQFFSQLAREFTTESGRPGWQVFSTTDTILAALVALAVVAALGALIPAVEQPARELLRLATFAMLGIVVVKLANTPDTLGLVERRQGAWIALGVTGIMASSANTIYNAPLTRRAPKRRLHEAPAVMAAPPRSTVFDSPSPTGSEQVETA